MTYSQYAIVRVHNKGTGQNLLIKFTAKDNIWGWTYTPDPDNNSWRTELALATIESHAIVPGATYSYGHTGYADRAEGCSAEIDLLAISPDVGSTASKICSISYGSPYSSNNYAQVKWTANGWSVKLENNEKYSPSSGALGLFILTVSQD